MGKKRRDVLKLAGSAGVAATIAGCLGDSDNGEYPTDTITSIVQYAEGGGTDVWTRALNPVLGEILDADFTADNIPGAGGLRGVGELYHSNPDGYTIGSALMPLQTLPFLIQQPDYEITELESICTIGRDSFVLVANSDYGLNGLDDLIEQYQTGEFETIGGLGRGDPTHVQAILAEEMWGLEFNEYVPYDGGGAQVEAAARDEIPASFTTDSAGQSFVFEGEVDVIAALHPEGSQIYPDAETAADQGYEFPEFLGEFLRGRFAPPGTDPEIIETLESAFEEALETDEIQEFAEEGGRVIEYRNAEETEQLLNDNISGLQENVDIDELREDIEG